MDGRTVGTEPVCAPYKPMKIARATPRIIHSPPPWVAARQGQSSMSAFGVYLSVYVYKCPLLMVPHLTGGTPTCPELGFSKGKCSAWHGMLTLHIVNFYCAPFTILYPNVSWVCLLNTLRTLHFICNMSCTIFIRFLLKAILNLTQFLLTSFNSFF